MTGFLRRGPNGWGKGGKLGHYIIWKQNIQASFFNPYKNHTWKIFGIPLLNTHTHTLTVWCIYIYISAEKKHKNTLNNETAQGFGSKAGPELLLYHTKALQRRPRGKSTCCAGSELSSEKKNRWSRLTLTRFFVDLFFVWPFFRGSKQKFFLVGF